MALIHILNVQPPKPPVPLTTNWKAIGIKKIIETYSNKYIKCKSITNYLPSMFVNY